MTDVYQIDKLVIVWSRTVGCFCCVRFSCFSTKSRDWLRRTSPK